uniref:Peptidase C1A papain C-terminal domain-containing protein n=1 Tax=Panagrolaimus davidi TaxID=227884 RepID=A0A914QTE0_9BILA
MFAVPSIIIILLISTSDSKTSETFSQRLKRSSPDESVTTPIPSSFDWRDFGKVTSVKNQGQCGSAWVHAVVASIESQYLIQKNQSLDLSEQSLLNCEFSSDLCYSSDNILPSFNYAKDLGLPLESCAPYISGTNGNVEIAEGCEACMEERYKIAGFRQYGAIKNGATVTYNEEKIAQDLYNFGPAAAVIYLPPRNNGTHDFYENVNFMIKNYTGGVLDIPLNICNAKCMQMTVVLIVGFTPDYLIAKGSFGQSWGENGYIRFKRGTNFCSMTKRVIAPFLEESPLQYSLPTAPALNPEETAPTITIPSGWTEWAPTLCTANCGKCGRMIMKRVCRGGICP